MHKNTLLTFPAFLLSGCIGLSSYEQHQSLDVQLSSDHGHSELFKSDNQTVKVSCNVSKTTELIMISPITPLPPMIPVSGDSDSVLLNIWPEEGFILVKLSVIDPKAGTTLFKKQESTLSNLPGTFSINYECSELSGKQLIQLFKEPMSGELIERKFDFKYIDEGSDFSWGFLGA